MKGKTHAKGKRSGKGKFGIGYKEKKDYYKSNPNMKGGR